MAEPDTSKAQDPIKAVGETAKTIAELLKNLKELGVGSEGHIEKGTRSGPLQNVGRLFLSLIIIVALATLSSGLLDWRIEHDMPPAPSDALKSMIADLSQITYILRYCLVGLVGLSFGLGTWLIIFLARKHPALLSSPSEFDQKVHQYLVEQTYTGKREDALGQPPSPAAALVPPNGERL